MSYTNPNAYEPSFREGNDLLHATGSISRPAIPTKGGFIPSVMGNLVQNGAMLVPLATVAAHRMLENPTKTRKQRGGKNWETLRDEAKRDLSLIGKASAVNINRLASIRKRGESNAQFLDDFAARKSGLEANAAAPTSPVAAPPPKPAKRPAPAAPGAGKVSTWQENRKRAKNYLTRIGKPSGPNIASYASMMRKGQNTKAFLNEFQARAPKVKEPKAPKAAPPPPPPRATSVREKKPVVPIYVPAPALLPPAIKTRKVGEKGVAWKENRERAKEFLSQYGQPRGTNITTFASIKRKGDAAAESDFLASFQSRPPPVAKQSKPRRMSQSERKEAEAYEEESKEEESKEEESKEEESKEEELPAQKPRKTKAKTESTEQWKLNRERAKNLLQRIGSATAAEISKLASMMRRNENTSGFLESVRSRVNATRKRLTLLKQKKELSTVPENVNENEAEPYTVSNNNATGYQPLLNKANNEVVNLTSNYQPPAYVPLPERNTTRKAPNLQNFRKHLQLLKQKLQREKV